MKKILTPNVLYATSIGFAIGLLCLVVLTVKQQPDARFRGSASTDSRTNLARSNAIDVSDPKESESSGHSNFPLEGLNPSAEPMAAVIEIETSSRNQEFNRVKTIFDYYFERQLDAFEESSMSINDTLFKMYRNIEPEPFADELLDFWKMGKVFEDRNRRKKYLTEQFKKHVLNLDQTQLLIRSAISDLNDKFVENDNQLIIECGLDIGFDPSALDLVNTDMSSVSKEFDDSIPELQTMLDKSFATNLLAATGGYVVGDVAGNIGYELGKSQNGEATIMSHILGTTFTLAGEYAGAEMTYSALQTKEQIIRDSRTIARRTLDPFLDAEGYDSPEWIEAMYRQLARHLAACSKIVEHEFEFDRSLIETE